jgi:hypothetical protein
MARDAERERWYAAQAVLTAIAILDATLWVNRGGSERRSEPVRRELGVTTDSANLELARKIRDRFIRYDRKINASRQEGLVIEGIGADPMITGHSDKTFRRR